LGGGKDSRFDIIEMALDEALKEWGYKKASGIKEYGN
jgi:hypothetical protein